MGETINALKFVSTNQAGQFRESYLRLRGGWDETRLSLNTKCIGVGSCSRLSL
jgi:hypothetical protein